jgi:hypothetical protein
MPLLSEAFIHVPMLLGKFYVERGIIKQSFFTHQSAYKTAFKVDPALRRDRIPSTKRAEAKVPLFAT